MGWCEAWSLAVQAAGVGGTCSFAGMTCARLHVEVHATGAAHLHIPDSDQVVAPATAWKVFCGTH